MSWSSEGSPRIFSFSVGAAAAVHDAATVVLGGSGCSSRHGVMQTMARHSHEEVGSE